MVYRKRPATSGPGMKFKITPQGHYECVYTNVLNVQMTMCVLTEKEFLSFGFGKLAVGEECHVIFIHDPSIRRR